jgi:hypothetical protein
MVFSIALSTLPETYFASSFGIPFLCNPNRESHIAVLAWADALPAKPLA